MFNQRFLKSEILVVIKDGMDYNLIENDVKL